MAAVTRVVFSASAVTEITISHPNKIVFPEIGATKLELAEYYLEVADAWR